MGLCGWLHACRDCIAVAAIHKMVASTVQICAITAYSQWQGNNKLIKHVNTKPTKLTNTQYIVSTAE
jgi:hypothetical protein